MRKHADIGVARSFHGPVGMDTEILKLGRVRVPGIVQAGLDAAIPKVLVDGI